MFLSPNNFNERESTYHTKPTEIVQWFLVYWQSHSAISGI